MAFLPFGNKGGFCTWAFFDEENLRLLFHEKIIGGLALNSLKFLHLFRP
jgi:hypothetical protein